MIGCADLVCQTLCIERCLGYSHPDMWPGDECRVAEQNGSTELQLRGLKIGDRLKKALGRERKGPSNLRRQNLVGDRTNVLDHFGPDERVRDGRAVAVAGGIRAQSRQSAFAVNGVIPHEVVSSMARSYVVVGASAQGRCDVGRQG